MKKCEDCECEAIDRQKAKQGLMTCGFCFYDYHFREGESCMWNTLSYFDSKINRPNFIAFLCFDIVGTQCSTCREHLGCEDCPFYDDDAFDCDRCSRTLCMDCSDFQNCGKSRTLFFTFLIICRLTSD